MRPLWFFLLTVSLVTSLHGRSEWHVKETSGRLLVSVISELPCSHVPLSVEVDFSDGVDPSSIVVVDAVNGVRIPHQLSEHFHYGTKGDIRWVVKISDHRDYWVYFNEGGDQAPSVLQGTADLVGVGELLRYNAKEPRPLNLIYLSGLADLNGDGLRDLMGCWNYGHSPFWPWDGIWCYPRTGSSDRFLFGDLHRLRIVDEESDEPKILSHIYMSADFADFDGDGRTDFIYSPRGEDVVTIFLNKGGREPSGVPLFVRSESLPRQGAGWDACRAVDGDGDGDLDVVVGGHLLPNVHPNGWPMRLGEKRDLGVGPWPCFFDVDCDGALDCVYLADGEDDVRERRVAWLNHGKEELLHDIDAWWCSSLAAVNDGPRRGLLVGHNVWQEITFFEQLNTVRNSDPQFRPFGRAESQSAHLALSDQAWPCICDWDEDGDWDLLVGGGYGTPRIVINEGTSEAPRLAVAKPILAQGRPIRILRDDILGGEHWHNMGYPFPRFEDWDGDGLKDLLLPNETNRIFWYRNVGNSNAPKFVERQQIICEGFPESKEKLDRSRALSSDKNVPNHPYPYIEDEAFFWRTGAGFADWDADGLCDLVTHSGGDRKLWRFLQYRTQKGERRLKADRPLKLSDGRLIDDSIVGRAKHWTESFQCVDWDSDDKLDLIYACAGSGFIYFLRNEADNLDPVFDAPVRLCSYGRPIRVTSHGPHPGVGDMDGDGKPDLLTCTEWSVYPFYSHVVTEIPSHPRVKLSHVFRKH